MIAYMDDQNKHKGGIIDIPGNLFNKDKGSNEQVKKLTDISGQNEGEDVVIRPGGFENVQSQSMVQSTRENMDEELARIKAYNEQVLHQQQAQAGKDKAKRVMVRILIIILSVALVVVVAWLAISVISLNQPTVETPGGESGGGGEEKHESVEGYDCKTSTCYKIAELPDGRVLLRDEMYYAFNAETKDITLLAIDNQDYHSVDPITWGENKTYIILDPESGQSALYSLDDNRMITGYAYDNFYTSSSDKKYNDMTWAIGAYIIAKTSGSYRLIRLSDGQEIVRGSEGVFIHDGYCFSYESGGERRAYTLNGEQIVISAGGTYLYIKNNNLIYVSGKGKGTAKIFDTSGETVKSGNLVKEIKSIKTTLSDALTADSSFYNVPESR